MNKKMIYHPGHWILLTLFVTTLLLSACQAQPGKPSVAPDRTSSPAPTTVPPILAGERPLPFRTISRDVHFGLRSKTDFFARSDFFVITSVGEIQKPKSQIADVELRFSDDVMAELRAMDYQQDFVVLVFRWAGAIYPDPRLEITEVTRWSDAVTLYVRFDSTPPKGGAPAAVSFPYHLIAVSKAEEGEWDKDIRFILVLNGKEVSEHTHFIP